MTTQAFQQTVTGTIVKKGSAQTAKVAVKLTKVHPIYRKRYTRTSHYLVHDQNDSAKVGDIVTIVPCKPISKLKRWTII